MLGRHVYRVSPQASGGWRVQKEGEKSGRGSRASQQEAADWAAELAAGDQPSKLIVEGENGTILAERLFGEDLASAVDQGRPPNAGEKRG